MFYHSPDCAIGRNLLKHFLCDNQTLLNYPYWTILERLWIHQLDRDGFLVFKEEIPAKFLKSLSYENLDYVAIKDDGGTSYLIAKKYLHEHPDLTYPSQLRIFK